jgi:hypothetical protein
MVKLFKRDLDQIVLLIVGDADQRNPFRLNLVTQVERRDLDFSLLSDQALREVIEEVRPSRPVDLFRGLPSTFRNRMRGSGR